MERLTKFVVTVTSTTLVIGLFATLTTNKPFNAVKFSNMYIQKYRTNRQVFKGIKIYKDEEYNNNAMRYLPSPTVYGFENANDEDYRRFLDALNTNTWLQLSTRNIAYLQKDDNNNKHYYEMGFKLTETNQQYTQTFTTPYIKRYWEFVDYTYKNSTYPSEVSKYQQSLINFAQYIEWYKEEIKPRIEYFNNTEDLYTPNGFFDNTKYVIHTAENKIFEWTDIFTPVLVPFFIVYDSGESFGLSIVTFFNTIISYLSN